jgi:polysaccharide deacetylase 2 family uncharacterized protein YibQ
LSVRLLLLACLLPVPAAAASAEPAAGAISIIIDDIGPALEPGQRAIGLPGPVAYAFLPHTTHSRRLAEAAAKGGKEVLLHLPMQAVQDGPLGPGAVTMDMDRVEFAAAVHDALAAVPHLVGVNNHMGSLLTRHPGHMTWLMQELKGRGDLFFVDSRTSAQTVAERMAQEQGVPALRRHVFLDHDPAPAAVAAEFERLIALARRQGLAVAIGHPYASTLAVLEQRLPMLQAQGIALIPLREMIARQQTAGTSPVAPLQYEKDGGEMARAAARVGGSNSSARP